MGVFDFLYKPRPRPSPAQRGGNYRARSSGSHYQQRTTTQVNRASSLPDEELNNVRPKYHESNATGNRSYIQKQRDIKKQNASKIDFVDYYHLSKKNEDLDDFSRLARLEIKLDDHMSRYFMLTTEMNKIEQDLILIRREFHNEYKEYLLKKANQPTVELGEKILNKMDHYYAKLEETRLEPEMQQRSEQQQPAWNQPLPSYQQNFTPSPQPSQQSKTKKESSRHTSRAPTSRNQAQSQPQLNHELSMNISAIPHQVPEKRESGLHRAHYVRMDDFEGQESTPSPRLVNRRGPRGVSHHQSTPSIALPPPPQGSPPPSNDPQMYHNDAYLQSLHHEMEASKKPLYLNMAMSMHSSHPAIENTFRRIDQLRPRLMMYNAEHKLRSYHEMCHELSSLMAHLERLDVGQSHEFEQDRNVALCELHNMIGMLERSVLCDNLDCVICNSFIFSEEVSV